jgi:hypothetical protein
MDTIFTDTHSIDFLLCILSNNFIEYVHNKQRKFIFETDWIFNAAWQ